MLFIHYKEQRKILTISNGSTFMKPNYLLSVEIYGKLTLTATKKGNTKAYVFGGFNAIIGYTVWYCIKPFFSSFNRTDYRRFPALRPFARR